MNHVRQGVGLLRGTAVKGELSTVEAVDRHIKEFLGPVDTVLHEIHSDLIHVDVHIVRPSQERDYWCLVTSGMSDLPMNVPDGFEMWRYCELMMCLPPDWQTSDEAFQEPRNFWPVRVLKMLARYPHENDTWFGAGHTVDFGDPDNPFSQFTALLIMRSQVLPLEALEFGSETKRVRLWSVYPLYPEEVELKIEQGSDVIEELFQQHRITEVFDPKRVNVAIKPRE